MRKVILTVLFTLMLAAFNGIVAQVRGEFEPLQDGFSIAKAIEVSGQHSLLVMFPKEYLTNGDKINEGIEKIVPIIFGCELWPPDCKAKITKQVLDTEGKIKYVYMDVVIDKTLRRLLIYGLSQDAEGKEFVGVVIMFEEQPKVILNWWGMA